MTRAKAQVDWTRTRARPAGAIALLLLSSAIGLANISPNDVRTNEGSSLAVRTIDVNTAPAAELELLPRIGPKLAEHIVTFRDEHGPFESLESLDAVPGIGPRTLDEVAPFVRFSAPGARADR